MAATDKDLGELHAVLARHLKGRLEEGEVSAAELGVMVAFLKNNNITADATTNAALAGLSEKLSQRRQKKLDPKQLQEAADAFAAAQGNFFQ